MKPGIKMFKNSNNVFQEEFAFCILQKVIFPNLLNIRRLEIAQYIRDFQSSPWAGKGGGVCAFPRKQSFSVKKV